MSKETDVTAQLALAERRIVALEEKMQRTIEHVAQLTSQIWNLEVGQGMRSVTRLSNSNLQMLPGFSKSTFDTLAARVEAKLYGDKPEA